VNAKKKVVTAVRTANVTAKKKNKIAVVIAENRNQKDLFKGLF
jgi:hypothetical protein